MSLLACRINGMDSSRLEVTDRGCQYGDGLFETLAVRHGRPEWLAAHLQRLEAGAARLGIPVPSREQWRQDIDALLAGTDQAVLKLLLTRGSGGRGYLAPEAPTVSRIVLRYPWPAYPPEYTEQGVTVRFCDTALAHQPALAGLKHLNRLEQVLARNEWQGSEYAEGLMLDTQGFTVEGTMSNLFLIKDDRLHAPDLSACGVDGIMRQQVIILAEQLGIPLSIGHYTRQEVEAADGLFLTNSVIGIWPVRQLGDRSLTIPALTGRLRQQLDALRRSENAKPDI